MKRFYNIADDCVGRQIGAGKTIVRGYVVLKKRVSKTAKLQKSILTFAGKRLARYRTPREIVFVEELPRTSTGKLIRKKMH